MLKTSRNTKSTIQLKKDRARVGSNSRAKCNGKCKLDDSEVDDNEVDGIEIADNEIGKKDQKMSKSKKLSKFKKTIGFLDFFIFGTRLAFIKFRKVFVKAPIFYHFDPKRHI